VRDEWGTRLISANCGSIWAQTFGYDAFGNITKSGSISWMPGYNSNNQYSTVGARYDADGNLLYDTFNSYTWDSEGKMVTARGGTHSATCGTNGTCVTYDALGRAVEKNVSGTYSEILYSPLGKTAIMSGQTLTNAYVPMPGGQSSLYDNTGGGHHFEHHNWRGDAVLRTSVNGRSQEYDRAFASFGEMYDNFGNSGKLNFTGDTQDLFSGLFDTPNRELAPTQGRWISPDPAGLGAVDMTDPQTWNRYAYVTNNPLASTDPSGLDGGDLCAAAGGSFGGSYLDVTLGNFECAAHVVPRAPWEVPSGFLPGEPTLPLKSLPPAVVQAIVAAITGNWRGLLDAGLSPVEQQLWGKALSPISDAEQRCYYVLVDPCGSAANNKTGCSVGLSCGSTTTQTHRSVHCTITVGQNGKYTAYDGAPSGNLLNSQLIVRTNPGGPPGPNTFYLTDSCTVASCIPTAMQSVNNGNYWYSVLFQNSNNAFNMMTSQCGINVPGIPTWGP
jgi:RHS repeat-associated protein